MSQIMKAFTGIFMVLFLTVSSMGILGAFLQVSKALNFHTGVIDELENSNYCKSVLEECFEMAELNGYELEVTLYEMQGGTLLCSKKADIPVADKEINMAKVDMKFYITIPFFSLRNEQAISGYGR
ncbi:MAG: hypothetical protein IJ274_10065 [Lachnospiraceae bacterium]|nr:hypothetical protein [Lachnospiraceae bacterium]